MRGRRKLWLGLRRQLRVSLDLILPPVCPACGLEAGHRLCPACRSGLQAIPHPCPLCATPMPAPGKPCQRCAGAGLASLDRVQAAWQYVDTVQHLLVTAKSGYGNAAVGALCRLAAALPRTPPGATLCPIPSQRRRGPPRPFVSHAVARTLAVRDQRRCSHLLSHGRQVVPQHHLNERERRLNLRGAFICRSQPPEQVVLVDDVLTTGSTLQAAARCLRQHGCHSISAICLARTPDPRDPQQETG